MSEGVPQRWTGGVGLRFDIDSQVLTITHLDDDKVEMTTLTQLAEHDPRQFEQFYIETATATAGAAAAHVGASALLYFLLLIFGVRSTPKSSRICNSLSCVLEALTLLLTT